uniref:Uncharacterized protein n=1 Tax=Amphimedon queenslandica TaxID=400682 RepID=A0A1X7VNU0_AMPQE
MDNFLCLYSPRTVPCRSLEYAVSAGTAKEASNITVFIEDSSLFLQDSVMLKQHHYIFMIGHSSEADIVTIKCNGNSGLIFKDISQVKASNMKFIDCGSHALLFVNCSLELTNVFLEGSIGSGVVIFRAHKYAKLDNVCFIRNVNGGLVIKERYRDYRFRGDNSNVSVILNTVHFINNTAFGGAGLLVDVSGRRKHNITISSSTFTSNTATRGGGVFLNACRNCRITFTQTNFSLNSAVAGGGMSAALAGHENVTFQNCLFLHNKAYKGAALHIQGTATSHTVYISDTSFMHNTIEHSTNITTLVSEYGTIVSHYSSLWLGGDSSITNNAASGITIGGPVTVSIGGNANFTSNTGMNGGAIALYDGSSIIIRKGLEAFFASNSAVNKGPALYFSHVVPRRAENCFLLFEDNKNGQSLSKECNCSMTFVDNLLSSGLNGSIYIASFNVCSSVSPHVDLSDVLCSGEWDYRGNLCKDQIMTGPSVIINDSLFTALSGKETDIPIQTYDESGHEVTLITPVVFVSFDDKNSSEETIYANYVEASTPFIVPKMSFASKNGLNHSKVITFWSVGDTTATTKVTAYIRRCPPGNYFNRTNHKCLCVKSQYFIKCHSDWSSHFFYLKGGWLMYYDFSSDSIFVSSQQFYQPLIAPAVDEEWIDNYMDLDKLKSMSALNEFSCGRMKREGILCSRCQEGYSTAVNSYNFICVKCSSNGMWKRIIYFLLLNVLPGIVFCFVLTLFSVRVSSDRMNAFVIYSQIISHPFIVTQLQYQFHQLDSNWGSVLFHLVTVPYGFWNLDFFKTLLPPFCLSPGMTNIHVWTLQYLSAGLPLGLTLILILLSNLYDCGCKPLLLLARPLYLSMGKLKRYWNIKVNMINVFATFFLLSYTKLLYTSASLLSPVTVYIYETVESYEPTIATKVYLQPDYFFFGDKHLPYSITAILLLFLLLLPPILLIGHSKRLFSRCRCPFQLSVAAFADVFYGSYKDGVSHGEKDCRYFAGIDLISRLVIVTILNTPFGDNIRYLVLPLALATGIILVTYIQPYRQKWANLIHGIFLSILISIVMTFSPVNSSYGPLGSSIALVVIAWIFAMIPMFYILLYALRNAYKRARGFYMGRNTKHCDVTLSDSIPYRLINNNNNNNKKNNNNDNN